MTVTESPLDQLCARLDLDEKCRLLGGASMWRTHALPDHGIPALKMSDGPNGVRGEGHGANRTPGVVIPAGIALGATWDPELVEELGKLLGRECTRKGAHVLLAPTVNLHRTPIGGRVFECYSEDPELAARLAVGFVRGVQSNEVAVTVKHFVGNDTEVDRMSVDVRIDPRVQRELYLRPFEAAVVEGGAWGVMSAYNRLDGEFCAGNHRLLTQILREEWGFDGFVVSDWLGAHDTVASAHAGLTVPMPGPETVFGERLAHAVREGQVREAVVDERVREVLLLIERTRARERSADRREEAVDDAGERALCRRAAADGIVLLSNRGGLPLASSPSVRVAVIGPNARQTRIMGGGSAALTPLPHCSIGDELADRLSGPVTLEPGVRIDKLPPVLEESQVTTPDGEPGLLVEYRNDTTGAGHPVVTEVTSSSRLRLFGSVPPGVDPEAFHIRVRGTFAPAVDGPHVLSAVITGAGQVTVGAASVLDDGERRLPRGDMFFGLGCAEQTTAVDLETGVPVEVLMETEGRGGFVGLRLGVRAPDPPDLLERAVQAAAAADVALVVVGTNDEWETEGEDRTDIGLPGEQDGLVAAVAAVNNRTIVIVNAGSPVAMPWVDDVAAVVVAYFGGEEMAGGLVDVLLGERDPGGRLPVTYPRRKEDTPSWPHYAPTDGRQTYGEGMLVGYRGFDASEVEPLFPFGHGLSYGTAAWDGARLSSRELDAGGEVTLSLSVTCTSDRPVTDVVQVYVAPRQPPVVRPPKELKAWAKLRLQPGETEEIEITLGVEAFRRWDAELDRWVIDSGEYEVVVAASATDERARLALRIR